MIRIGISQIRNSTKVKDNFETIKKALLLFEKTNTDLILFPECSLSGFSAKIKECTQQFLSDYLSEIEKWSKKHKKYIILPTAIVDDKIYNSGFIFGGDKTEQFYKLGLTKSEKKFFSSPAVKSKKVFSIKGYKLAVLLCFEAQMSAWEFFEEGEADIILWPGYWGWEKEDSWQKENINTEPNLVYQNMNKWKMPLIQSNFSFNDLVDFRKSGPHGLSIFVNADNKLIAQGEFEKEACYKVTIENNEIVKYEKLGDL